MKNIHINGGLADNLGPKTRNFMLHLADIPTHIIQQNGQAFLKGGARLVAWASSYRFSVLVIAVGAVAVYAFRAFSRHSAAAEKRYSDLEAQNEKLEGQLGSAQSDYSSVSKEYETLVLSKADQLTTRIDQLKELIPLLEEKVASAQQKLEPLKQDYEFVSKELESLSKRSQMIAQLQLMTRFMPGVSLKGMVAEMIPNIEAILEHGIPSKDGMIKDFQAQFAVLQDITDDVNFEQLISEQQASSPEAENLQQRKQAVDDLKQACSVSSLSKEELKDWAVNGARQIAEVLQNGLPDDDFGGILAQFGKNPKELMKELPSVLQRFNDILNDTDYQVLEQELKARLPTIEASIADLEGAPKRLGHAKIQLKILEQSLRYLKRPLEAE